MAEDQSGEDDLYGVARQQFVTERAAVVKRLRAAGRREEAAQVAALKRPSVVAWSLNQVARSEPELLDEFFCAAQIVFEAMEGVLRGDPSELREATARQREAGRRVRTAARQILDSSGGGASEITDRRISETLQAAGADPALADLLARGRLTTEARPTGFGTTLDNLEAPVETDSKVPIDDGPAADKRAEDKKTENKRDATNQVDDEGTREERADDETTEPTPARLPPEDSAQTEADTQREITERRVQDEVDRLDGRVLRLERDLASANRDCGKAAATWDRAEQMRIRAVAEATERRGDLESLEQQRRLIDAELEQARCERRAARAVGEGAGSAGVLPE